MASFAFFFFSSRRRHTRLTCDWSSDVCSSDLDHPVSDLQLHRHRLTLLPPPRSDRDDLTLNGLLLGRVGDVETALHGLALLERLDRHAVGEGEDFYFGLASSCRCHGPKASTSLCVDVTGCFRCY